MTRIPLHLARGPIAALVGRSIGRPLGRRKARLLLAGAFALALGAPAYAQTTTAVGGDLGSFIQNLIDLMNSNIIRGLAVLAVILTGIAWMFGHLDMRRARMGLWLNPRVCAATEASDFDLRMLRSRRMSVYLAVSPDNLGRVAPLYALLFQQLIDVNTRERPSAGRHPIPVLLLLDEFARLGHAETVAKGFAFVAGYGLRLLPVLQSPAQLRAEYGPDLAEEIVSNCGAEVAFAPKALKLAQDLSERLGPYTYLARSRSRPSGLAKGSPSLTESDQRRPLLLPHELIQLASDQLIVLRAGLPPVRGRKIVYWRERIFATRVRPPPILPPRALPAPRAESAREPPTAPASAAASNLTLDLVLPQLQAEGWAPLPPEGATPEEVEAWVDRFIDGSAQHERRGTPHGR